jgi:hypothetical protein
MRAKHDTRLAATAAARPWPLSPRRRLLTLLLLAALMARASAARILAQLVETHAVKENPPYAPQIATTRDGFGGQAAALSNPNSAGACVLAGGQAGGRAGKAAGAALGTTGPSAAARGGTNGPSPQTGGGQETLKCGLLHPTTSQPTPVRLYV